MHALQLRIASFPAWPSHIQFFDHLQYLSQSKARKWEGLGIEATQNYPGNIGLLHWLLALLIWYILTQCSYVYVTCVHSQSHTTWSRLCHRSLPIIFVCLKLALFAKWLKVVESEKPGNEAMLNLLCVYFLFLHQHKKEDKQASILGVCSNSPLWLIRFLCHCFVCEYYVSLALIHHWWCTQSPDVCWHSAHVSLTLDPWTPLFCPWRTEGGHSYRYNSYLCLWLPKICYTLWQ